MKTWKDRNRQKWSVEDPYAVDSYKRCSKCTRHLPREMFSRANTELEGLQKECNDCHLKRRRSDPRKQLLVNARRRSMQKGVPFAISLEDILIPETCPVLGLKLAINDRSRDNSPSLDRIIPAKGYVPGNIQIISHKANTIKSNATANELELVATYMRNKSV